MVGWWYFFDGMLSKFKQARLLFLLLKSIISYGLFTEIRLITVNFGLFVVSPYPI